MRRTREAAVIALFAALVATPALVAFSWLAIGPQSSGNHLNVALILSLAAVMSAFVSARLLLARAAIETYADGMKLGLLSSGIFYLGWLFVFALVPALIGAPEGVRGFLGFFLSASGHVVWTSGGLPVIGGVAAGLMYIVIKRRLMPAAHG